MSCHNECCYFSLRSNWVKKNIACKFLYFFWQSFADWDFFKLAELADSYFRKYLLLQILPLVSCCSYGFKKVTKRYVNCFIMPLCNRMLHFWAIFVYLLKSDWNMKKKFCCPALELFHYLPLWKTVLFVSSRAFLLSTPTFLFSTPVEKSEATWKKATKCHKYHLLKVRKF